MCIFDVYDDGVVRRCHGTPPPRISAFRTYNATHTHTETHNYDAITVIRILPLDPFGDAWESGHNKLLRFADRPARCGGVAIFFLYFVLFCCFGTFIFF